MSKIKRLIVNADDFGLHAQINNGIIKGYREGFITSTSIMSTAPAYQEAVKLAKENEGLGIGIHLTLVGGVKSITPQAQVASLLDDNGLFVDNYVSFAKRFYSGAVKMLEVEKELRGQIERVLEDKLNVTHLDSHQHIHVFPGINSLVTRLGVEYNIRCIRNPREGYFFSGGYHTGIGRFIGRGGLSFCSDMAKINAHRQGLKYPDHFFGMLAGGNLDENLVANIIQSLPDGVSEIMTHPGLHKDVLAKHFTWNYHWEDELQAFLSDKNKCLLKKYNITLTNFGGLI